MKYKFFIITFFTIFILFQISSVYSSIDTTINLVNEINGNYENLPSQDITLSYIFNTGEKIDKNIKTSQLSSIYLENELFCYQNCNLVPKRIIYRTDIKRGTELLSRIDDRIYSPENKKIINIFMGEKINVNDNLNLTIPSLSYPTNSDGYMINWNGQINITQNNNYYFSLINSLNIISLILDNNSYSNLNNSEIELNLGAGLHNLNITYLVNEQQNINLFWKKSGEQDYYIVPDENLIFSGGYVKKASSSKMKMMAASSIPESYPIDYSIYITAVIGYTHINSDRTPILLVHGLHGSDDISLSDTTTWTYWNNIPTKLDSLENDVWTVFYVPANVSNFRLSGLLKPVINNILLDYKVSKLDIVAHSMGGLMTLGYIDNLGKNKSGSTEYYGNNVRKIVLIGSPLHGSMSANRILLGLDSASYGCNWLADLFGITPTDKNAQAYLDLAVGSEFTYLLNKNQLPSEILSNMIVMTGNEGILCVPDETLESSNDPGAGNDGLVAVSSASLLDKNVPLIVFGDYNHANEIGASALIGTYDADREYKSINAFIKGYSKSTIKSYFNTGDYYIDPSDTSSNPFNKGSVIINIASSSPINTVKLKNTNNEYYSLTKYNDIKHNTQTNNWYYFSNNADLGNTDSKYGLTLPKGTYKIYVNDININQNIEIKGAQTSMKEISINSCTPLLNYCCDASGNIVPFGGQPNPPLYDGVYCVNNQRVQIDYDCTGNNDYDINRNDIILETCASNKICVKINNTYSQCQSIDSDNDGINDSLDLCPNTFGNYCRGCPIPSCQIGYSPSCPVSGGIPICISLDSDNDNIRDIDDSCPTTPGNFCNGCPNIEPNCSLNNQEIYCPTDGAPYCVTKKDNGNKSFFSLFTDTSKINVNDTISQVKSIITSYDLSNVLKPGNFFGNVNASYTQTIDLGASTNANSPRLKFAKQPTSWNDPAYGFAFNTNTANPIYNMSITFNKAVNFASLDSKNKEITLFGEKYTIGPGTDSYNLVLLKDNKKITLSTNSAVVVGDNGKQIDGTLVSFIGGTTATTKIVISVAAENSDNDALMPGESFIDPIFNTFQLNFSSLNIPDNSSTQRENIYIRNIGNDKLAVMFTNNRDREANIQYVKNNSYEMNLQLDDYGRNIIVIEGGTIYKNEYVVVGNEDQGYLLKLSTITNSTGNYIDDKVELTDVFDSNNKFLATITSEGTGTLTIGGKVYSLIYNASPSTGSSDYFYITLNYPDTSGTEKVVYPTMQTSKGAKIGFYKPLNISLDSNSGIKIPNGNGYTEITWAIGVDGNVTLTGGSSSGTFKSNAPLGTSSAIVTVGSIVYNFTSSGSGATDNRTILYMKGRPESANIAYPALFLIEEKDDNSAYNGVIITSEPGSGSIDGIGINSVLMTWTNNTNWNSLTLASNSNKLKSADLFGTIVLADNTDSDQKNATISYPDEQLYADINVQEILPIICSNNSQCGTDGPLGAQYCGGEYIVSQDYVAYTCNNPGTTASYCSNVTTTSSVGCSSQGGGGGYPYCKGNSVYRNTTTSIGGCQNGTCVNILISNETLIQNCNLNQQCFNGSCINITCFNYSNCGNPGYIGDLFCSGNNSVKNYINFTCNNPGTIQSYCSNSTTLQLITNCGTNSCSSFGNNYCKGNSIYRNQTCYNKGCSLGACFNNTYVNETPVYNCTPSQTCSNDTCICSPSITNTTWSSWTNISCLKNDKMNQSRYRTEYDSNNCPNSQNKTFYEYRETEYCNNCSENITEQNTSWSICSISNLSTRMIYYKDINYQTCCAITNLSTDCGIRNNTYVNKTETKDCDYCTTNIIGPFNTVWTCLKNDSNVSTLYYTDLNYRTCCLITGLDSDCGIINNFLYQNKTESKECDFCKPNIIQINTTCNTKNQTITWYNDTNKCFEKTGLLNDSVPKNETYDCDYCNYSLSYTDWSLWQDQESCRIDDKKSQVRSRVQYDSNYNSCYAITNLPSDLWNDGENKTLYDYQNVTCPYCEPDIQGPFNTSWSECIDGRQNYTEYYIDYNYSICCKITGLDNDCQIDLNKAYENVTYIESCNTWMIIHSPLSNGKYDSKNMLMNISSGNFLNKIEYIDYSNKNPTFKKICTNKKECKTILGFSSGFHNITAKGTGVNGTYYDYSVFFVDNIAPKITKTYPKIKFYANSSTIFTFDYEEVNPAWATLYINDEEINGVRMDGSEKVSFSGFLEGYDGQDIYYSFELMDISGNTAQSRPLMVHVDTSPPVINNPDSFWRQEGSNYYFNINIDEKNLASVQYFDGSKWRTLCSRLSNGICSARKTIKTPGNIKIKVIDKAGNSVEKEMN